MHEQNIKIVSFKSFFLQLQSFTIVSVYLKRNSKAFYKFRNLTDLQIFVWLNHQFYELFYKNGWVSFLSQLVYSFHYFVIQFPDFLWHELPDLFLFFFLSFIVRHDICVSYVISAPKNIIRRSESSHSFQLIPHLFFLCRLSLIHLLWMIFLLPSELVIRSLRTCVLLLLVKRFFTRLWWRNLLFILLYLFMAIHYPKQNHWVYFF